MTALVLAAGFSTRLYPLTKYFPKALLPIGGKSVAGYMFDDLLLQKNLNRKIVVTNDRYEQIFRTFLKSEYPDAGLELVSDGSDNPEGRIGAIGDILFAIQKFRINDDLLVLSSDTYTSLKLNEFLDFFREKRGVINAVFDTKNPEIIRKRLGCVEMEGERIATFEEKPAEPKTTLTSIPYYIFPQAVLPLVQTYLRDGNPADAPGSIIAWLLKRTEVFGYILDRNGYYHDIGTIETYNQLAEKGITI